MRIDAPWIAAAPTQSVCAALTDAGHQALFVGGCVRNALIGAAVSDIDIATDALPQTVTDLAERAGLRVVPTGIDHGTVTVIAGGIPHEVTTFRRDVETHGRRATVAWSADLAEDAARRDFTMNALYARPDGVVVDPLGGLPDLLARRVRFVGDAEARIAEDYLRILRFFRFHAWYGDPDAGIDRDGLAACAAHVDGLAGLSRERVGAELRKLLSAPDPAPTVAAMQAAGVLGAVLPGADARALAVLVHLEAGASPRWLRRLAALGGADPAAVLRLSRREALELRLVRDESGTGRDLAEIAYRHGAPLAGDVALVRAASTGTPLTPEFEARIRRGAEAVFPVRAEDLMPRLAGPALGAALRAAEDRWIASGFALGRSDLLD